MKVELLDTQKMWKNVHYQVKYQSIPSRRFHQACHSFRVATNKQKILRRKTLARLPALPGTNTQRLTTEQAAPRALLWHQHPEIILLVVLGRPLSVEGMINLQQEDGESAESNPE